MKYFLILCIFLTSLNLQADCKKVAEELNGVHGYTTVENLSISNQNDSSLGQGWYYSWEYSFKGRSVKYTWSMMEKGNINPHKAIIKNGDIFLFMKDERMTNYHKEEDGLDRYSPYIIVGKNCEVIKVDASAKLEELDW